MRKLIFMLGLAVACVAFSQEDKVQESDLAPPAGMKQGESRPAERPAPAKTAPPAPSPQPRVETREAPPASQPAQAAAPAPAETAPVEPPVAKPSAEEAPKQQIRGRRVAAFWFITPGSPE